MAVCILVVNKSDTKNQQFVLRLSVQTLNPALDVSRRRRAVWSPFNALQTLAFRSATTLLKSMNAVELAAYLTILA